MNSWHAGPGLRHAGGIPFEDNFPGGTHIAGLFTQTVASSALVRAGARHGFRLDLAV